jgi:death on curing protein
VDLYTLSVDDVVAIYHEICDTTAAPARPDGLESAVAAPFATYGGEYLHGDLFTMAAALLRSIAQNQPFLDGNKRVGWVAAVAFLHFNGFEVVATADEVVRVMVALATRVIGLEELAAFLADHVTDPIGTGD